MSQQSEHAIQVGLMSELARALRPGLVRFAIPNGGLRHPRVAQKMKAEGALPGMPDIGFAVEDGRTHWLELKTPKGRLSDEQHGIKHRLENLGHSWALARSVDEALEHLSSWGLLR